jgi:protein-disulfide isomerase
MARPTRRYLVVLALAGAAATFVYIAGTDSDKPAAKPATKAAAKATPAPAARPAASPAAAEGAVSDPAAPVATVGGRPITLGQLAMKFLDQQDFEARKRLLDSLINDDLVDKESAAKGVAKEKLLETEVTAKVPEPSQAEIDAWFEQNKASLGNQTKEQLAPRVSAFLKGQKLGLAQKSYYAALREKYKVDVLLKPPRVAVSTDDDAAKGPDKAPVTIVEFSDFQCPFCSRAETTVLEVLKKYGDKVRLVYRDYPLPMHPNAEGAAEAAECAKDQGKFWEMHNAMFANQQKLASADLVETAGGLGMDKDKFKACLDGGKKKDEVQKDAADGQKYGVSGTPTFFINGIKVVGAQDISSFAEIIDQELQPKKK